MASVVNATRSGPGLANSSFGLTFTATKCYMSLL